jgi:hypothetical protein
LFVKQQQNELLPHLSALIEIQKSRMKPELFESLEGACCRWKCERVLEGPFVVKFKNNNMLQDLKMPASMPGLKDSKDHIQAETFSRNFLDLKENCRIVLELKKENDFHPGIYFKTVKEEDGKERIGMFAGRNFPRKSTIGFCISHPWLRWTEPFTIQPSLECDKHFQDKHLLPVTEANSCFWFYDDEGIITACDPLRKPLLPEGTEETVVPSKRILGMGLHLVSEAKRPAIIVDDDGPVKTTMKIKIDAELAMQEPK